MFAPLPLPLPSVHAAAIVAILEQARDSQLSQRTVVGPTTTAIAQRCQGTAICSLPPLLQEQAREWPAMPRHCCPPRCQLVVAPASKGWLTAKALKRELKKFKTVTNLMAVSFGLSGSRPFTPSNQWLTSLGVPFGGVMLAIV